MFRFFRNFELPGTQFDVHNDVLRALNTLLNFITKVSIVFAFAILRF